jgi:hypothetical protein
MYNKHVLVLTYLKSIVYDWLKYTAMRTAWFIQVDRCEIHAVHELLGI